MIARRLRFTSVVSLAFVPWLAACDPATEAQEPIETRDASAEAGALDASADDTDAGDKGDTNKAPFPAPEWTVHTPEAEGLRKQGLEQALDYAFQEGKHTQGVVIIRHRALVAERYEAGREARSFGASWSVGKSFASALVGIAIDRGLIANVDVKMSDYYADWKNTTKDKIRLRDVLQMASGLSWVEDYRPAGGGSSDITQMVTSPDELGYASSREVKSEPGSVFNYSSGDSMLISGVLARATGMSAGEFAQQELFAKIGMAPVDWWRDTQGHTLTYCCVDTPSREFAKFGLLFLERGKWNGKQVISEAWIEASLSSSPSFAGYGYFWWLPGRTNAQLPADTFAANGVDGQHIYVIPSLDLVVVRNGHYDKYAGAAVADPNLFLVYPSFGLGSNAGTIPPDTWSDVDFLGPIVSAVIQ